MYILYLDVPWEGYSEVACGSPDEIKAQLKEEMKSPSFNVDEYVLLRESDVCLEDWVAELSNL